MKKAKKYHKVRISFDVTFYDRDPDPSKPIKEANILRAAAHLQRLASDLGLEPFGAWNGETLPCVGTSAGLEMTDYKANKPMLL